jgi:hypothetical protein
MFLLEYGLWSVQKIITKRNDEFKITNDDLHLIDIQSIAKSIIFGLILFIHLVNAKLHLIIHNEKRKALKLCKNFSIYFTARFDVAHFTFFSTATSRKQYFAVRHIF